MKTKPEKKERGPLVLQALDYHRNGVCGAPFWVLLFTDPEFGNMVGVVFEAEYTVAVFNRETSWRPATVSSLTIRFAAIITNPSSGHGSRVRKPHGVPTPATPVTARPGTLTSILRRPRDPVGHFSIRRRRHESMKLS